jgi:hypothetical protein
MPIFINACISMQEFVIITALQISIKHDQKKLKEENN